MLPLEPGLLVTHAPPLMTWQYALPAVMVQIGKGGGGGLGGGGGGEGGVMHATDTASMATSPWDSKFALKCVPRVAMKEKLVAPLSVATPVRQLIPCAPLRSQRTDGGDPATSSRLPMATPRIE